MNKSNELENLLGKNSNLRKEIHQLENELVELYKCLYPNNEDIIKHKCPQPNFYMNDLLFLGIMRDYHKKQLEKEKMKKLIKECMEEINKEKE